MNQHNLPVSLLQQSPDQVIDWIQSIKEGLQPLSEGFNWLGLAEGAAFKATSLSDLHQLPPDVKWARVALSAYDYLISHTNLPKRDSFEYNVMNLRAYFILKLGVVVGDPLLDGEQIVHWFFDNLRVSAIEATERSAHWRELPGEAILQLRMIKNKLSIIKPLVENNSISPGQELLIWLALYDTLP